MRWFRKSTLDPLAVTMPGVKLGDRLLVVGCSDPGLIAALAVKTGLTGRACAVDADADLRTAAAAQVQRQGALVETFTVPWTELPFERDSFDVVVLRSVLPGLDAHSRVRVAQEAHCLLRGGGRCLVIDPAPRGGLGALLNRESEYASAGGAVRPLEAAGFRGVRVLAEREGSTFVEGVKSAASD
jgi:SAM-dependent methyltransferase